MARLTIELPDDLLSRLEVIATIAGSPSLPDYVEAVLREHLLHEEELEQLLLERLHDASPDIEATPQFWEDIRQRFADRRDGQSPHS